MLLALSAMILFSLCGVAQQAAPNGKSAAPEKGQSSESSPRAAGAPQVLVIDGEILGKEVPARPGEICLVCGKPIGADDVVYLIHGQRVALHAVVCFGEFDKTPYKYLDMVEPHGAFLGMGGESQALSLGWFFLGLYILLGLIFAALCAHQAMRTGHSATAWFGAGLALNAVGYLLLITRRPGEMDGPEGVPAGLQKIPLTYSPRACPVCGAPNHPSATQCSACGAALEPQAPSEARKAGLSKL